MLCSLIFVLYMTINQLLAYKQLNCTFPPLPKNGYHISRGPGNGFQFNPDLIPDPVTNKVKSFDLQLKCNHGYSGIGSDILICCEDGRMIYTDFECLPNCEQSNNLLSCGKDNRCVMNPKKSEPLTSLLFGRAQEDYEECGVPGSSLYQRHRRESSNPGVFNAAGGRRGYFDELPWHAGVYSKKTRPYMQICGGTLVSTKVVISAAHCFWHETAKQLPASDFAVAVGKVYRPWNEPHDHHAQKSDVAEIKIPPHFHGHATNLQEDIALVIVTSPFKYGEGVRPACLSFNLDKDQRHLEPQTIGTVAGWGLTSENGAASPVLQVVELPVVDLKDCFQHTDPGFRAHITGDKFCAGLKNGTAVCKGDSGGGFFVSDFVAYEIRFFLRGIVSGSPQNENLCNVHSWASFTHVLKHEQFIKKTLEEINTAP